MRVTKTIREFIEKEVSNRLDAKYTAEKEEADFQTKVEQDVWEAAMDAAQKAYDEYMAGAFAQYGFLKDLHTDKDCRCAGNPCPDGPRRKRRDGDVYASQSQALRH